MSDQRKQRIPSTAKWLFFICWSVYLAGGRIAWIGDTPWSKRPLSPVITGQMASVVHGDWLSQLTP